MPLFASGGSGAKGLAPRNRFPTVQTTSSTTQLASVSVPNVTVSGEGDGDFALGTSNLPYQMLASWDSPGYSDAYSIDLGTGRKIKILEKIQFTPQLSPAGKFVYWWDRDALAWWTISTVESISTNVTRGIPFRLDNELHDWPYKPNSYGSAGWTENDFF